MTYMFNLNNEQLTSDYKIEKYYTFFITFKKQKYGNQQRILATARHERAFNSVQPYNDSNMASDYGATKEEALINVKKEIDNRFKEDNYEFRQRFSPYG